MTNRNESSEVWVYAETHDKKLQDISIEICGKGRELANKLGVKLGAVLLGSGVEHVAASLFEYGVDNVYLMENIRLSCFRSSPFSYAVTELIKKHFPQVVLFGASRIGRDLAPRVASALQCGLTADCTNLDISDVTEKNGTVHKNLLLQTRPAFGGNIIATIINYDNFPQMATVREGVFPMPDRIPNHNGKVIREYYLDDTDVADKEKMTQLRLEDVVLLVSEVKERTTNLKNARVIVAGGAGVGSKENFKLLFDLANLFGGAVGASRAAVDSGYINATHQIGQTGTTVRPTIYIACGISGMVQHRVGMEDSAKIIAINTDKNAPIFSIAHYGIVGDLKQVIPLMVKAFHERN
jgi:electron transfer flavoprotein alpha subunit